MNKSEIIIAITYVGIPRGAVLQQHSEPGSGVQITRLDAGYNSRMILAQMFADQLTADTAEFPETPDARLFERLHADVLSFHQDTIVATNFEHVKQDMIMMHRKMIAELAKICTGLGLTYNPPNDPLLRI